jgi:hypothetical protein
MAFDSNIKGYMTFGKSFSRGAAFPLEAYEIWTDYDALVAYAANTDPNKDPSYIGQKVAYVDKVNNKVTHYGIEIDGTLKELGASPIGDEKSIVIGDNNTISLKGIAGLVFERDIIGEDGEPTGQKENVQFQPLMTKDGLIWVEPSKTTVEGLASLIDGLTARVSALENDRVTEQELADAIKVVADKIGVPAEGDTSTATLYERIAAEILRATQAEGTLSDRIGVAKDGETAATGVYAYVDGVVNALVNGVDPDKIDSLNELIAWVEAHPDIVSDLDERLGAAEAILEGFGGEEEPATVKEYVEAEFDAHELAADGKYATKTEITEAGYAVATDVARDYATKQELTNHETSADGKYATKTELSNHETAADAKYATKEFVGTFTTGEDNYKDITTVVGYINKKAEETLAAAQGGSSETAASVKLQLDNYKTENDAKVQKNANDIVALQEQLGTTNTNVSNNTTEIGKINTDITVNVKPAIEALEGADEVIEGTLAEHTAAIKTINETTIPALQGAVNTKAAQSDVDAINTKIGAVEEGKTVVDMINAVAGKIDFSPYAKKEEVAKTYATIAALEDIYKAGEGEAEATGVLAEEIARAKAAEKKLGDDLAILINNPTEDLDSVVEIIEHVKNNGTAVTGIVTRLDGHDTLLAGIGGEGQPATVVAAIEAAKYALPGATAATLGGIKSAADVDGKAAVNKVYVDATTHVAEVKAFSTDNLVQGAMTLVLNGGDAQVTTNA